MYVNTAEEDSMVVQFVLAWRKGKRELIPDPPPTPVEEVKKEEPTDTDAVANETDEAKPDDVDKPIESSESELKKESELSEDSKSDEQEANATEKVADDGGEKKADEKDAPAESESTTDVTENVEQKESEKVEIEKPSDEQQPMETQESETKPESEETKMECEDEKTSDQPEKVIDESAKATDEPELSEKSDEQPMETEQIKETKDEVKAETETETEKEKETETENESEKEKENENKTDTETEVEAKTESDSETKAESASKDETKEETATSDENAANVEKKDDEAKSDADDDDDDKSDKPEPVYIEVDEYYVKYRNFSYLHCEWRTEEELLKGDRRVSAKIRRFEVKKAQQMNIFENLEDEPFNPDFVETDRVLDMSVHEDPVTGKKTRHLLVKWKSLPYEDATWEIEDDVEEKKIEEYLRFSKVPPKDKWKPKRRPTPDMWRKLDETPVYKNNNTLRAYQLEGLNWLKFSWYNSHNCILADEMGLGKTVSLSKSNFAFFCLHFQI